MDTEVLIISTGTTGLATADALLSSGVTDVLLLDSYCPPHDHASHHGRSRLIRVAYGESARYVRLAQDARRRWQSMGRAMSFPLYHPCGVLNVGRTDDLFLNEVLRSSEQYDLSVEQATATDIQ